MASSITTAEEAVAADRARFAAVLALPGARGPFRALTWHLLNHTELGVGEIAACLAAAGDDARHVAAVAILSRPASLPQMMH